MKPVVVSVSYVADIQAVFDAYTEFDKMVERITDITALRALNEKPVGVGYRWEETRVMFGKEATEQMEITDFQPNQSYRVEAQSHGSHYLSEYTFQQQGENTTVSLSFSATPLSFMAKVMGFIMGPIMSGSVRKCLEKDMADLRKVIEPAGASSPS